MSAAPMGAVPDPRRLVLCAAPEDRDVLTRLDAHLRLRERTGLLTTWHEGELRPGEDRAEVLLNELLRADIILLLISASFLGSDECYELQMKRALERHERGEALVIPVLVRPVDWEGAPFGKLPALPENLLPVTMWRSVDEALQDIERGLLRAIAARAQGLPFTQRAEPLDPGPAPTQERVLDAAVPSQVIVGELSEVLAMVTTTGSGGLRALIQLSPEAFAVGPGDVKSTHFDLDFPVDAQGRPRAATVTVLLESADFDPPVISKKLLVPPRSDSTVCTLLVKPRRAGRLSLQLAVHKDEVLIWSQRLQTRGGEVGAAAPPAYVLTRVPLSTMGREAHLSPPIPPPTNGDTAGEGPPTGAEESIPLPPPPDRRTEEERYADRLKLEQQRYAAEPRPPWIDPGGYGPPLKGLENQSAPPTQPTTAPSGPVDAPPGKPRPTWSRKITLLNLLPATKGPRSAAKEPLFSRVLFWGGAALLVAGIALFYYFAKR